jgi:PAS domain S-box-containing protein
MEQISRFDVNPQQQEKLFQNIFTDASIGMAIVGLDGRWLRVNPSLCELIGYTKEELLRMTFEEITHPEDLPADLAFVRQLMEGEIRSYNMEKRYFHKAGHMIWISLNVSLSRNGSGEPLYFNAQITDITERRQIEDALRQIEERYRTLLDSIDEGFGILELLFDEENRPVDFLFVEMNPAFKRHNKLEPIAVGKTILELYPDIETWWIETYGKVALTGEPVRFEKEFKHINHWFDIYAFRLGGADSRKVAVLFNDITERKMAGFELKQIRQSLDERVRELESVMAESKRLAGIISICSYCKDIRNHDNFWVRVEDYISQNSEALFSHSICPKCYAKVIASFDGLE